MNISLSGYGYNLGLSTLGNIIGGAVFVAGLYWVGSPRASEQARAAREAQLAQANGVSLAPAPVEAGS
jgi:hypothetical protein